MIRWKRVWIKFSISIFIFLVCFNVFINKSRILQSANIFGNNYYETTNTSRCSERRFIDQNDLNTIGANTEKPMVALASFPGSGNTWLRYLLQQVTGIWTGSIYVDPILAETGFIAEGIANKSVLFVKSHQHGKQDMFSFGKAVLVVRDPAEAILSDFNWRKAGHIGHAGLLQFNGTNAEAWKDFVNLKANVWESTNLGWINQFQGPILIIFYNDLKENVEKNLRNILNFVDFPIDEKLMKCALQKKEGLYKRAKIPLFDPFTADMKKMLDEKRVLVYAELDSYMENQYG